MWGLYKRSPKQCDKKFHTTFEWKFLPNRTKYCGTTNQPLIKLQKLHKVRIRAELYFPPYPIFLSYFFSGKIKVKGIPISKLSLVLRGNTYFLFKKKKNIFILLKVEAKNEKKIVHVYVAMPGNEMQLILKKISHFFRFFIKSIT